MCDSLMKRWESVSGQLDRGLGHEPYIAVSPELEFQLDSLLEAFKSPMFS